MKYYLIEVYTAGRESKYIKSATFLNDQQTGTPLKLISIEYTAFFWDSWPKLTARQFSLILDEIKAANVSGYMHECYDELPPWAGGHTIHVDLTKNGAPSISVSSEKITY